MRTLAFAQTVLGQTVQAPGGIGGQCVDLVNIFVHDVLNRDYVRLNAADWRHLRLPSLPYQPNLPHNFPLLGDIVIWMYYPAHDISLFGHIAICIAADPMHLVTLDQDWPNGSGVALTLHDYGGITGWLKTNHE